MIVLYGDQNVDSSQISSVTFLANEITILLVKTFMTMKFRNIYIGTGLFYKGRDKKFGPSCSKLMMSLVNDTLKF